ncbi:MAG: hypothetical protein Q4G28_10170 [Neisseria sp.]|nr:hypothetical protein [Neisseria sp.]
MSATLNRPSEKGKECLVIMKCALVISKAVTFAKRPSPSRPAQAGAQCKAQLCLSVDFVILKTQYKSIYWVFRTGEFKLKLRFRLGTCLRGCDGYFFAKVSGRLKRRKTVSDGLLMTAVI